jgi:drug/metabolite transporter (DMT)-like permease
VLRLSGQTIPFRLDVLKAFLGMGLLNNAIPFTLIMTGQKEIASGLAAILNATTPLFTVLVAHALTAEEKLGPHKLGGVILGFGGVVIMIGGAALQQLGSTVLAQLMVLGAALSYAFAAVYGRRFKRMGVSPLTTATGQVTASSVLLLPAMLLHDQPWTLELPSQPTLFAVVAMALFSTALAYIIFFRLLSRVGATNLSLVTFLIPVTAIVLGNWQLGETLLLKHYLGMLCILGGLTLIDGRLFRSAKINST